LATITFKSVAASLVVLGACLSLSPAAFAADYDLVINGGRVMDPETMYDDIANVGIQGGKIAAITKNKITGKKTINAKGLVVVPGFIDTHYHAVDPFGVRMALRDGVTTGMDLEQGATSIAEWYEEKVKTGWPINYGTTYMMIGARMMVHDPEVKINGPIDVPHLPPYINEAAKDGVPGWSVTRSDIKQMNQVMKLMDEGLREGALGIGVGAAYMARGMTSYEQFEAQRTAARYGRFTAVHSRFHLSSETPSEAPIGVDEILVNAMLLKAPLLLCHDNDYGWWEDEEKLQMARAQGYNVWGEYYPYTAGSTGISADFLRPEMWEAKQGNKYEETVYDPQRDKYLTKQEYLDTVAKDPGRTVVVQLPPRKRWLPFWLRMPEMVVASDAMPGVGKDGKLLPANANPKEFAGHPRASGTYALTLQLARENNVPLMFTVAQTSYWSAKHMGDAGIEAMKERGRIQVGKVADLTLFDPVKVASRSTYKAGEQGLPPVGIPYVIVNGTIALKNGQVLDVNPGQPIRYPVESKGRFMPVEVNKWLDDHAIKTPGELSIDDTGATKVIKKK
jgi:N-acyl-D-amino-acid deacylase